MYFELIQSGVVVLCAYLLIFLLVSVTNRKIKDIRVKHVIRKNIVYTIHIAIFIILLFLWLKHLNSLTIFIGVVGAGITLALQEVILCIVGWFIILIRKPFDVGDRIELDGVKGDVIDIRIFQTALLEIGNWVDADQSTGRIVNVPNSFVIKRENYNYNKGFEYIWNEIIFTITFESNWQKAESIILKHAEEKARDMGHIMKRRIEHMTKHYMIYYQKLTPIVYITVAESGINLTLRHLTEARARRAEEDDLTRRILKNFTDEPDINFAYTTYRLIK